MELHTGRSAGPPRFPSIAKRQGDCFKVNQQWMKGKLQPRSILTCIRMNMLRMNMLQGALKDDRSVLYLPSIIVLIANLGKLRIPILCTALEDFH